MIVVTDTAKDYLVKKMSHHQDCAAIRIKIETRGCNGQAYVLDYVGANYSDQDQIFSENGITFVTDPESLSYFDQGLKLDYVKKGLNAEIQFINPKEAYRCGCGESFTL